MKRLRSVGRGTTGALALAVLALTMAACSDDGAGSEGPPGGGGLPGPEGPPGPEGNPDEASISGVSPAWMWLSRSETVTISGYNTDWDDSTTVDFGAGVTVDDVVVASPTSIVADITVADTAGVGPRDVVVGDVTLGEAFDVRPGLDVQLFAGDGTQGSYNILAIDVLDHDHELVGSTFTDPTMGRFMHTMGGAGQGISPLVPLALPTPIYEPHFALVEFLVDAPAPANAPVSLVTSDPLGNSVVSTGLLTVAPKTPVALTLDDAATVAYGNDAGATHLFEYTNDEGHDALVDLSVTPGDGGELMLFRYARNSGRHRDGHLFVTSGLTVPVRDGESVFMMALAPDGETGFSFDAEAAASRPAAFYASEETDDNECENAQDSGLDLSPAVDGFVIDDGVFDPRGFASLGNPIGESDWYRLSFSAPVILSCTLHSNHDTMAVSLHTTTDCIAAAAVSEAGDYYLQVRALRVLTMRGPERYSVVCQAGWPK